MKICPHYRISRGTVEILESRVVPAVITAQWVGGNGNWSDASHWDIGVVPNNGGGNTYNVIIDIAGADPLVTLNSSVTVSSLISHEPMAMIGGSLTLAGGNSIADSTFDFQYGTLRVTSGGTLALPGLTSYQHVTTANSRGVTFEASGVGSVLDLSNITTITSSDATFSDIDVQALSGGKVDLSSLTELTAGTVHFKAQSTGSILDLSSMDTFNSTGNSTLEARNATVTLKPGLASLKQVGVVIEGTGVMDISSLTQMDRGYLQLIGASRTLPNLTDAGFTGFYVSGGGTLALPGLTGFNHATTATSRGVTFEASGVGSVLDVSNITTMTSSDATFSHMDVQALSGGKIDLSGLTAVTAGTVRFKAQSAGSVIDLSALDNFNSTGNSTLEALTSGVVLANNLRSISSVTLNLGAIFAVPTGSSISGSGTIQLGLTSAGTVDANQNAKTLTINGPLSSTGNLRASSGGKISVTGSIAIDGTGSVVVGPTSAIEMTGNLSGTMSSAITSSILGTVRFKGSGTLATPQTLEVMGRDFGTDATGFNQNFSVGTLALANNTRVQLVDQSDNAAGSGAEALYLNSLIVPTGTTLDLNGLNIYARATQIAGTIVGGTVTQIPDSGPLNLAAPTPGNISVAGELDDWTFFGRAGRLVTIAVNPGTGGSVPALSPQLNFAEVRLLDANNNVIASASGASSGALATLNDITLPADGTYHIQVRASAGHLANTGNYTVALYDVTRDVSALSLNQQLTGSIQTAFSSDQWTFSAVANQQIRFDLRAVSGSGLVFTLTGPNGDIFTDLTNDSALITLTDSGNYSLNVHGTGEKTGSYTFRLDETSQTNLALGASVNGTLVGNGHAQLYRIDVPLGQPLRLTLDDGSTVDQNNLYVKYGTPPTRADFDYRSYGAPGPDQQVIVPLATPGTWYALVYGDLVPTQSNYTLSAEGANLLVQSVTPDHHGNSAATTITLTGAGFDTTTAVSLVAGGGASFTPTSFTIDSPTQITATFAAGIPAGAYTVHLAEPGITKELPNAFTVTAGGQAVLQTNVVVPGLFGRHGLATIYVEYANTGTVAMPAPLLTLYGSDKALLTLDQSRITAGFWTSAQPEGFSDTIQILASGATPGVLQPGENISIPVYFAGLLQPWDFGDSQVDFDLRFLTADDTTPIDWATFKDSMRPDGVAPEVWEPVFANFTANSGGTLGQYVHMLGDNANYLGKLGLHVVDVGRLLNFEYSQADALSPLDSLERVTDFSLDAPGFDLVFSRVFSQHISQRYTDGPFGYGWSSNWDVALEKQTDGTIVIHGVAGSDRVFQPDSRSFVGKFFSQPGDHGRLVALPAGGGFDLREPDGLLKHFGTDGKLAFVEDTNGNRIATSYTGTKLASLTHTSGRSLQFTWNASGHISQITDNLGRSETFTYDAANKHLVSVSDIYGQATTYGYSIGQGAANEHALTSIQYPGNTHQFFSYDAEGRLAELHRDGGAESLTFTYDSAGKVSVTDALTHTTDFFFDHRGLVVKLQNPLGNSVLSNFDGAFNLTSITDAAGQLSSFSYDSNGNLTRSVDALGHSTSFTYTSEFNRLASFTDSNGHVTRYGYDSHGNLTATTYADGSVERASYNLLGELDSLTNRRGHVVGFQYDSAGHITQQSFADGSHLDYTYDSHDRLLSMTDESGTTTFDYDTKDRLSKINYPHSRFLQFTYDDGGRRTQSVDQDGFTVNYTYDAAGRLAGLKDAGGNNIAAYTYDATGALARQDNGNGTFTTYEYDAAGQLTHLINHAPNGSAQSRFDYTYDSLGRRTSMDTLDGLWTYEYDATGQLTHAVFASTNVALANQDLSYTYDAAGNRIKVVENGVTTNYSTNNLNQYTTVGSAVLTYDADGNLTRKVDGANVSTYTYNDQNRLVGVTTPQGTWAYEYNALGHRTATLLNGVRTEYVWDLQGIGNIVGEYIQAGTGSRFAYGHGLVKREDQPVGSSYYAFDGFGSTNALTGETGVIQSTYSYDPFGAKVTQNESFLNHFQFGGRFGITTDQGGDVFMRARYYSSSLGRFSSLDPISLSGGDGNLYRFVLNSPVNAVDPQGTFLLPLAGAGAIIGGSVGAGIYTLTHLDSFESGAFFGAAAAGAVGGFVIGGTGGLILPAALGLGAVSALAGSTVNNLYDGKGAISSGDFLDALAYAPLSLLGPGRGFQWGSFAPGFKNILFGLNGHGKFLWKDNVIGSALSEFVDFLRRNLGAFAGSGTGSSIDPNQLIGPAGFGANSYVSTNSVLPYRIDFENDAIATLPAQHVAISNQLDSDLDWSTFELSEFGFGDYLFSIPKGSRHFQTTMDVSINGHTFQVLVETGIVAQTGLVFASFQSVDPATSLPPDILTGFLPPEDGTGRGMGHISYTIKARADAATGTDLSSIALITFDSGETIATNQVNPHNPAEGTDPTKEARNKIDADTPTSAITTPVGTQSRSSVNLAWQGSDVGSGIVGYDLYVSDNGGAFTLAQSNIAGTSTTYAGQAGHTYGFYTIARDGVGLREAAPTTADTLITLSPAEEIILNKQRPKYTFTDEDGTKVTVVWSGPGTATLHRASDSETLRGDLLDAVITGSTTKSSLKITPTKGTTSIGSVEVQGAIASLKLKGVDVTQSISLSSTIASITLGNLIEGADISIAGALTKGGVKVAIGDVTGDSSFTSASPIAKLVALNWADGAISAPSVGSLTIGGNGFGADLTLNGSNTATNLANAKIAGAASGLWIITGSVSSLSFGSTSATWDAEISGNVSTIKVAQNASGSIHANTIKTFTVGGNLDGATVTLDQQVNTAKPKLTGLQTLTTGGLIQNSTIAAVGNIGKITTIGILHSAVTAGVATGSTGLPDSLTDFSAAAAIGSITLKGKKGLAVAFQDSIIAAQNIGAITLREVLADNGNNPFGIAADRIAKVTVYQGKTATTKLTNLNAAEDSITDDDFLVRVM